MIINYLCTDYLWHCVTVYTGTHSAASFAVVTNMTQQLALNERVGNVSSYVYLNHEVLNDTMKSGAFIAQGNAIFPLLPRAKLAKVLRRVWNNVSKKFHLYPPSVLSSDRHVKKYHWILLFAWFPCSRHF